MCRLMIEMIRMMVIARTVMTRTKTMPRSRTNITGRMIRTRMTRIGPRSGPPATSETVRRSHRKGRHTCTKEASNRPDRRLAQRHSRKISITLGKQAVQTSSAADPDSCSRTGLVYGKQKKARAGQPGLQRTNLLSLLLGEICNWLPLILLLLHPGKIPSAMFHCASFFLPWN